MLEKDTQPFSFKNIVGNIGTMNELKERSLTLNFPEVMLFAGPSGSGKTTTAYIIAALLAKDNAEDDEEMDINPATGAPYTAKDGAKHIIRFKSPKLDTFASNDIRNQKWARDVRFYNAADLGKDGILKLEETMSTMPFYDGHRTIIIDEAQEISKAGKGAALALLERKRKNTTIILCTMNPEAFDRAVKDRCRVYNFAPPTTDEIARYLERLIIDSPIDYSEVGMPQNFFGENIVAIAYAAQGSVRAAVGMLDRSLAAKLWDIDTLQRELGIVTPKVAGNLLEALYKKKAKAVEILEGLKAEEALRTLRYQLIAIRRFQVVGEPFDQRDAGICNAFGKDITTTGQLVQMVKRIEDRRYVSDDGMMLEVLEYLKPTVGTPNVMSLPREELAKPERAKRE
jgi:DNA polymerase III gamma/tau subunit